MYAKHNILSLYSVILCMCLLPTIFVIGNQLVCYSLGKATTPIPIFGLLPINLCLGLRTHELFPIPVIHVQGTFE